MMIEGGSYPFAGAVSGQREKQTNWRPVQVVLAGVVLRAAPARADGDHLERQEALLGHVIGRFP